MALSVSTFRFLSLSTVAMITLSACVGHHGNIGALKRDLAKKGDYWQRTDTTSAIWTQGPKAQQMLNRDISTCVAELSELVRLGQIKSVVPANPTDVASADSDARKNLMAFETPDRDGALLSNAQSYTDFESCMHVKGWERTMNVGGSTADRAATAYIGNHVQLKKFLSTTTNPAPATSRKGPYGNLNN